MDIPERNSQYFLRYSPLKFHIQRNRSIDLNGQVWWHAHVVLAAKRLRQEGSGNEASQGLTWKWPVPGALAVAIV